MFSRVPGSEEGSNPGVQKWGHFGRSFWGPKIGYFMDIPEIGQIGHFVAVCFGAHSDLEKAESGEKGVKNGSF